MDAENGEEHRSSRSSQTNLRDRKEKQKLICQETARRSSLGVAKRTNCRCGVGVRQRETPEGRDRHNKDEKERRRELAEREMRLASVLGVNRSFKKKELLRRARKEIEILKSKENQLAELKRNEQMCQERLKGQLNVLTRIQPEVPPQIWRNELASAVSIGANDISHLNPVYSSRERHRSISAWEDESYQDSEGVRSIIALRTSSSAEFPLGSQHENALQLPHGFDPFAAHIHKTQFQLVPGAAPSLPPLMNVGISAYPDFFPVYPPTIFAPSMVPLVQHCSRGGSTDSGSSSPSNMWTYSPESSPHSDERQCAEDSPLGSTLSLKREPEDSRNWECYA